MTANYKVLLFERAEPGVLFLQTAKIKIKILNLPVFLIFQQDPVALFSVVQLVVVVVAIKKLFSDVLPTL